MSNLRPLPVNDDTPVGEIIKVLNALVQGYCVRHMYTPWESEPTDKYEGMVVWADGVNWNPSGTAGLHEYRGGVWQKL